ncbi:MAG: hypothetical protein B7733_01025 [Myxococcales bacterium FL481]|nr:MAG: hypothetical protein B7733_01025 [Myxococcales bacterium FL481]
MRARVRRGLAPVCAALLLGLSQAAGCWHNPASGRAELALLSEDDERRLGAEIDDQIRDAVGLYKDGGWDRRVAAMGARLAAVSERSYLKWRFRVLDDPTPNAFALPGGYVYVTRGLLAVLGSDDELASVIAHEIGHVTARHSVNQLSKTHLARRGLGVFRIIDPRGRHVGGFAAGAVQLRLLHHSRADELEADDLGARYVAKAGGRPQAMIDVLETLRRIGAREPTGQIPPHLSTHPDPELRIVRQIERLRADQERGQWSGPPDADYVQRLDGMPYGADPQEGYLLAGQFVCPRTQLALQFPADWEVEVMGGFASGSSPDEAALLLVGTGDHDSAKEAEASFFAVDSFVREGTWVEQIGGRPVRASRFSMRDRSAAFPGWAVFAQWGGGVHLAVGLAEDPEHPAVADLRAALLTLGEPSPQQIQVEPSKLRVVTLSQSMTLRAFAEHHRASVSLVDLMLLNRRGADVSMPTGTVLRTVVGFNPARQ